MRCDGLPYSISLLQYQKKLLILLYESVFEIKGYVTLINIFAPMLDNLLKYIVQHLHRKIHKIRLYFVLLRIAHLQTY